MSITYVLALFAVNRSEKTRNAIIFLRFIILLH